VMDYITICFYLDKQLFLCDGELKTKIYVCKTHLAIDNREVFIIYVYKILWLDQFYKPIF